MLKSEKLSWSQLIQRAREGCDEALGHLVSHFESYLLLVAGNQINDKLQAKFGASDVVQSSFVEARRSITQFRGSSEYEMREWLKQIVLNNLRDQRRRYAVAKKRDVDRECDGSVAAEVASTQGTPSAAIRRRERDHQLRNLVDELPKSQQRVLKARHRDGLSYAEIAARLEISEAYARKLWSRATATLRERLRDA